MDKPLLSPLELEDLFEARMNRALDDYAEVMVHIGKVATYES